MKKLIFIYILLVILSVSGCSEVKNNEIIIENDIENDDFEDVIFDENIIDVNIQNDEKMKIYEDYFGKDRKFIFFSYLAAHLAPNPSESYFYTSNNFFIFENIIAEKQKILETFEYHCKADYSECVPGNLYSIDSYMEHSYEADNFVPHTITLIFEGNFVNGPYEWTDGFYCVEESNGGYDIVTIDIENKIKNVVYRHDDFIDRMIMNEDIIYFVSNDTLFRYHFASEILDSYLLPNILLTAVERSDMLYVVSNNVLRFYVDNEEWEAAIQANDGNDNTPITENCKQWLIDTYGFEASYIEKYESLYMFWYFNGKASIDLMFYDFRTNSLRREISESRVMAN